MRPRTCRVRESFLREHEEVAGLSREHDRFVPGVNPLIAEKKRRSRAARPTRPAGSLRDPGLGPLRWSSNSCALLPLLCTACSDSTLDWPFSDSKGNSLRTGSGVPLVPISLMHADTLACRKRIAKTRLLIRTYDSGGSGTRPLPSQPFGGLVPFISANLSRIPSGFPTNQTES